MTYKPAKTAVKGVTSVIITGASCLATMLLAVPDMCADPYTMAGIAAVGTGLLRAVENYAKHHND